MGSAWKEGWGQTRPSWEGKISAVDAHQRWRQHGEGWGRTTQSDVMEKGRHEQKEQPLDRVKTFMIVIAGILILTTVFSFRRINHMALKPHWSSVYMLLIIMPWTVQIPVLSIAWLLSLLNGHYLETLTWTAGSTMYLTTTLLCIFQYFFYPRCTLQ
jgi:hypothetical protein